VTLIPPDPPVSNIQPQPPVELPPWSGYPGGGWPDISGQIPGDQQPLPENGCRADPGAPANGPFTVPFGSWLTDTEIYSKVSPIHCFIRAGSAANPSRYTINGFWQLNTEGEWAETPTDDWYNIYGLDSNGTRVATGIHDPVTNPGVRTGSFNPPAGVVIENIEIAMTWPSVFAADNVNGHMEGVTTTDDPGVLTWSVLGPGIMVDWINYRFTVKSAQPLSVIDLTNSTPISYFHKWFHATGWAAYYSDGLLDSPSWEDWAGYLSWNDIGTGFKIDKDFQRRVTGADTHLSLAHHINCPNGPYPWNPYFSYVGNMRLYITPMPTHRLNVRNILLWNICG
jgi:hypothetical protein